MAKARAEAAAREQQRERGSAWDGDEEEDMPGGGGPTGGGGPNLNDLFADPEITQLFSVWSFFITPVSGQEHCFYIALRITGSGGVSCFC